MATSGFHLAYGDPDIRYIAQTGSTANSFVAGDIVYLSSGLVTICANDATIFGVAQGPCTGTALTLIPVSVINPNQTWIAEFDAAQTRANIGEDYGITHGTGDSDVTSTETTNTACTVVDLDPRDGAVTAAGGRVYIKFLPGVLQTQKGSGTSIIGS